MILSPDVLNIYEELKIATENEKKIIFPIKISCKILLVCYLCLMTESLTPSTTSIHAASQSVALNRNSIFWMIMKREDGTLFPREFKFRKFNRKANTCEWSRFGTSIQDAPMKSSIDYVERKSFQNVHEAHKAISLRSMRRD